MLPKVVCIFKIHKIEYALNIVKWFGTEVKNLPVPPCRSGRSAVGSASHLECECRRFKSYRPDQTFPRGLENEVTSRYSNQIL